MRNAIGQLNLPPRELKKVSVVTESHGKVVDVAVDVCDLVVQAFMRRGYRDMNAAACLGMKPSAFSKAFRDVEGKYPDQNAVMKRLSQVPFDVMREFFALGSEKVGLVIGIQHEQAEAAMRLAESIHHLMKVSSR